MASSSLAFSTGFASGIDAISAGFIDTSGEELSLGSTAGPGAGAAGPTALVAERSEIRVVFSTDLLTIVFGAVFVSADADEASFESAAVAGSAVGASGSAAGAGAPVTGPGDTFAAGASAVGVSVFGASWARTWVDERATTAAIAVVARRYVLRVYVIMDDQHVTLWFGRAVSDEANRNKVESKKPVFTII